MLDAIPADLELEGSVNVRNTIAEHWAARDSTPARRWQQLKATLESYLDKVGGSSVAYLQQRSSKAGKRIPGRVLNYLEKLVVGIVLTYAYPRLDIEVSKTMNHLLKAPFCVHPKTGRVCVPIDVERIDEFDPAAVPTVAQLSDEVALLHRAGAAAGAAAGEDDGAGGAGGDVWRRTTLRPYVELFERFVRGCEGDVAAQRRAASDRAAAMGDF